jgi:RNA polymerase sigma-70 factor (ECF subfamily)
METGEDITALLRRFQQGDDEAQTPLIQAVYSELRLMASRYMAREKPGHTLQATALVNEAYMRLVKIKSTIWQDRVHFFAVAARIMRHILVDHARKHMAGLPEGGKLNLLPLEEGLVFSEERSREIVELDEAMERLAKIDERACRIVELRFFGGLSVAETAEALNIAQRSVERDWTFGRAWLRDELTARGAKGPSGLT